jgi:hypothetical protein
MPRQRIGVEPMSPAERQARHRAKLRRPTGPAFGGPRTGSATPWPHRPPRRDGESASPSDRGHQPFRDPSAGRQR